MGNRAIVTFSTLPGAPAIYLHWNGGRASIDGFLAAARDLSLRNARHLGQKRTIDALGEMIARHFFGVELDALHVYRVRMTGREQSGAEDNGVFVLSDDLRIVDRIGAGVSEEINEEKTEAIREFIAQRAPVFND